MAEIPESVADPVAEFDRLLADANPLFVVYYRGHWCPFCRAYLRSLSELSPSIIAAGGNTVAVTAELGDHLAATRAATGYRGAVIVDPANLLATHLRERGLLDIAISSKAGYAHGMAQPGVLVLRSSRGEGSKMKEDVFYKWAIVPGLMNFNGAKDRPLLGQIWADVHSQVKLEAQPEHRQEDQQQEGGGYGSSKRYDTQSVACVVRQFVFG